MSDFDNKMPEQRTEQPVQQAQPHQSFNNPTGNLSLEQAIQQERETRMLASHIVNTDERFKSIESKLDTFIKLFQNNTNTGIDNTAAAHQVPNVVQTNMPQYEDPVQTNAGQNAFYEAGGAWKPIQKGSWGKVFNMNTGKKSQFGGEDN